MEYEKECDYIVSQVQKPVLVLLGMNTVKAIQEIFSQFIPDGEETTDANVILIKGNL